MLRFLKWYYFILFALFLACAKNTDGVGFESDCLKHIEEIDPPVYVIQRVDGSIIKLSAQEVGDAYMGKLKHCNE